MKKMLVALGVAVVLAGLAAAPAGAAKGSSHPSVQYVEGSYSGTGSSTVLCDGGGMPVGVEGHGDVSVRASNLGRGELHWTVFVSIGGPPPTVPNEWTFTAQDGKSTLGGSTGISVVGPFVSVRLFATFGTGKFEGVSSGVLDTRQVELDLTCSDGTLEPLTGPISGTLTYG